MRKITRRYFVKESLAAGVAMAVARTAGNRDEAFQLKNGVPIYGGFQSAVAPDFNDRDPDIYETILSGDIGTPGDNFDNSYHVFYHPSGTNLDTTAILDGFTVTSGNADGSGDNDSGGGIYNDSSSPTVTNCIFRVNSADYGGGIYNDANSDPTITNCTFSDNSVDWAGGGIYNGNSNPTVTNCTFSINSADGGGGIYNSNSSPTVTNCTFSGNSASAVGGGIYNNSDTTVTNCILWGNTASSEAQIYNVGTGSATVTYWMCRAVVRVSVTSIATRALLMLAA